MGRCRSFFVLSGFLISGLLFSEYKLTGTLDVKRFLFRRGWKIYPAFWVLIVFTLCIPTVFRQRPAVPVTAKATAAELLFVQNYVPGLWGHTWTLAVEEHFYLALAALFAFLVATRRGSNPFSCIPALFAVLAIGCLVLRAMTDYSHRLNAYDWFDYCGTHLRFDSLFFGVLVSYLCHFHDLQHRICAVPAPLLAGGGLLCLLPAFVWDISRHHWYWAMLVITLYIGGGLLVLAATRLATAHNLVIRAIASLGAASYSIYLWHFAVNIYGTRVVERILGFRDPWLYILIYVGGSLIFGFAMNRVVETPLLRLRDRMFPTHRQPLRIRPTDASE